MHFSELSIGTLLLMTAVLTVLSAYFSGSETAMMALNRFRLRHLVNAGHRGARKANRLLRRPDRLLAAILIGNNLVNFTAASLATVIGLRLFGDTGVLLAPIVLTLVFLVFAEVAPKTIAAQRPESIAFRSVYVLDPLMRLLHPAVLFINFFANGILRPLLPKEDQTAPSDSLTAEELRTVVTEGVAMPQQGQSMMLGILDLEKVTVDDIMVPRNEIVGLDIDADMDDLIRVMATSRHTRLPVYRESINNILGILHLRKVVRHLQSAELTRTDLLQLTEEPYYIPEATPLHTQLVNFQKEKKRIALVVDEYGEIRGLATLEDILEEIVGEFTTDFAASIPEIHPQPDGSYVIDGLALVRDINRALAWDLPTLGPKTLNGLVLEHLESLPENNLCLTIDDYRIETLQIKDNVIKNLKVTRSTPPAPVERGHDGVE
ncbi:MAG: HlyC/CorC family transporter [Pseudomonadales bacterium]|nr:HlyC/CorC family transporter [Pseudomonadales bacterium]